jgi:hypothetical protein
MVDVLAFYLNFDTLVVVIKTTIAVARKAQHSWKKRTNIVRK